MNDKQAKELEQTILSIYSKNIEYFKIEHKNLYSKIKDFENKNYFQYSLSFENNHFELINENNTFIYNCDPFYDASTRVDKIEETGSFSIIKTNALYYARHINYEVDGLKYINNYISLIKDKKINKSFSKFIFLGTLLGVHLNDIDKKIKAQSYLIIEDSIDIFRLSLFLTDYKELEKNSKLYFCINENTNIKAKIVSNFLRYLPQYNHNISFELASEKEIYLIEDISSLLINENEINYPYSEYILSFTRGLNSFNHGYKLLNLHKQNKLLENYDVLFLGAGLSLHKDIEFIKNNQNNFLILAIAATLKTLQEHNIIPDIILTSDSGEIVLDQFDVKTKYYSSSLILASIKTNPKVMNLLNKNNTIIFNDSLELFEKTGTNTGINVGNTAYSILLKSSAKSIYLLGFDACIDEKSGRTHSTKADKINIEKFDVLYDEKIDSLHNVFKVKGNFKESVYTNSHFKNMITSFYDIENEYSTKSYNLSDGAYLAGCKALRSKDIKIKNNYNKKNLTKELIKEYVKESKDLLSKKDKKILKENFDFLIELKNLNKNNIYLDFIKKYSKKQELILAQILNNYFILINPYYEVSKQINEKKANDLYLNNFLEIIGYLELSLKKVL